MKILYFITGLGGGGAEKVVVDLANRMYHLGHQVKIAYLKSPVVVSPNNENIELVHIGLENVQDALTAYKNYKKLITAFQPDIVHAHMVHANIFARIARKFTPIPKLICTAHSNNEGGRLRMLAYKLTHRESELTTNVSKAACESFELLGAVPKGQIRTVYNGIDLDKFKFKPQAYKSIRSNLNIDSDAKLFLAVGRFHKAKDYLNLIKAFYLLVQRQRTSNNCPVLIIAGEGEERSEIEAAITNYELSNNVKLLGRRDDIVDLMSAADFFVLSSVYEGFGLVVAEAMACETFVVATNCGGVKEVMGGHGLLAPIQNSDLLAEQLIKAMSMDETIVKQNNLNALEHVKKNFDLDKITKQWLEIYAV
ncbi:glycosyltransferase [Acinetobacter radioresistens]|uniref:glycosyltransferase n=1 Tax=Acinetobacter radioresistens TaxID=40216 RepID=UPI0021CDD718|nr:glycosyltransferase [Acinetobacter radioresistens]MCU4308170.1 glycosyltransferase [Acinetobacter radioresistens]